MNRVRQLQETFWLTRLRQFTNFELKTADDTVRMVLGVHRFIALQ